MRVLVADDNDVNLAVLKGFLEYGGHQVKTVLNGENAIRALKQDDYDLVIMDCLMPVMDGFEATRRIRASDPSQLNPNVPILAITALATSEDRKSCMEAGMNGYISKPVMARDLFDWIEANVNTGDPPEHHKNHASTARHGTVDTAELLGKLAPSMLRDAEQWKKDLQMLAKDEQLNELGALAHKIRGTADILGKSELSQLSRKLEVSAKVSNASQAAILAGLLVQGLDELIRDIKAGL